MHDLRDHDWSTDPIFDSAIVSHGFTSYLRDYVVIAEVPAARPDGSGSHIEGRYRYRFTHCVEASVKTSVTPEVWKRSWGDEFVDFAAWERAGQPDGFVWGTGWADAYPGVQSVQPSQAADAWSAALGRPMHGIRLETNAFVLDLVCHQLVVTPLANG